MINFNFLRLFILLAFAPTLLLAQAPSNDLCANAEQFIFGLNGLGSGSQTMTVNLSQATFSPNEFNHPLQVATNHTTKSVWYYFDLKTPRLVTIKIQSDSVASSDVGATFYRTNSCPTAQNGNSLSNSSGFAPITSLGGVTSGTSCRPVGRYFIQVVGKTSANGPVTISVVLDNPGAPFDEPATAYNFGVLPAPIKMFDYECLTLNNPNEICSGINNASLQKRNAWFTFQMPSNSSSAIFRVDNTTGSFNLDNIGYALYQGEPNGSLVLKKCGMFNYTGSAETGCSLIPNQKYTVSIFVPTDYNGVIGFGVNSLGGQPAQAPNPNQIPPSKHITFQSNVDSTISLFDNFNCNGLIANNLCGSAVSNNVYYDNDGMAYYYNYWIKVTIPPGDAYFGIRNIYNYYNDNPSICRLFSGDISTNCNLPLVKEFEYEYKGCSLAAGTYSLQVLGNGLEVNDQITLKYVPAFVTTANAPDSLVISSYSEFKFPDRFFPCDQFIIGGGTSTGGGGGGIGGGSPSGCFSIRHLYNIALSCPTNQQLDTIWYREITNLCGSPVYKDTLPFSYGLPCYLDGINYTENVPFNENYYNRHIFRKFRLTIPASVLVTSTSPGIAMPFTLFKGDVSNPNENLHPLSGCTTSFQTSPCRLLQPGVYSIISFINSPDPFDPVELNITTKGPVNSVAQFDEPYKAATNPQGQPFQSSNTNTGTQAYPETTNQLSNMGSETFDCENNLPMNKIIPCCPITEYNRVSLYTIKLTQESAMRVELDYDSLGLPVMTKLFRGSAKTDSTILKNPANIISECNHCRVMDFCKLAPDNYTLAFFSDDFMAGKTLTPIITVDAVGVSPNDELPNAYDFGTVPINNQYIWEKQSVPNTQPYGRKGSYSEFGCETSADTAESFLFDLFNNVNSNFDATKNFPKPVAPNSLVTDLVSCQLPLKTLWYTFTLNGIGKAEFSTHLNSQSSVSALLFEVVTPNPDQAALQPFSNISDNFLALSESYTDSSYYLKFVENFYFFNSFWPSSFEKTDCTPRRYCLVVSPRTSQPYMLRSFIEVGIKFDAKLKQAGDSCINAKQITLTPSQPTNSATTFTGCHTLGEGFGEDGSYNDCLSPMTGRKTTWFKINFNGFNGQKIDLSILPTLPTGTKFRLLAGTCSNMAVITCAPANTGFTLSCMPSNLSYYIQLSSPEDQSYDAKFQVNATPTVNQGCINDLALPPPTPEFFVYKDCYQPFFTFQQTNDPALGVVYHWYFGTGNPADTLNAPAAQFSYTNISSPTNVTATLKATNIFTGISSIFTKTFLVNPSSNSNFSGLISGDTLICAGGTVTLTGQGGFAEYLWDDQTTAPVRNVGAGAYTLNVKTPDGCWYNETITVAEDEVELNLNFIEDVCFNAQNGTANFTTTFGSLNEYHFDWPSGADQPVRNNLEAGVYNVNVQHLSSGCTKTYSFSIGSLPIPSAVANTVNPQCAGQLNGSIQMTANQPNTTFFWPDINATTTTRNGLDAGNYPVIVQNTLTGCRDTLNYLLVYDPPYTINANIQQPTCIDANDGAIAISSVTHGLFYQWSNGSNAQQLTNLSPGDYLLTVNHPTLNCEATFSYTLQTPPSSTPVLLSIHDKLCFGQNNGYINLNGAGMQFRWLDNQSPSPLRQGLSAGTYQVEVKNSAGMCAQVFEYEIIELPEIPLNTTSQNVNCFGGSDGMISIENPSPNISYVWLDNGIGFVRNNLSAGNYTILASDNINNCYKSVTITIAAPPQISISSTIQQPSCPNIADGSINVTSTVSNLAYNWDNGVTNGENTNLLPGAYTLTVFDANSGCSANFNFTLVSPQNSTPDVLLLNDTLCAGETNGQIQLGGDGLQYLWLDDQSTNPNRENLSPGVYQVQVINAAGFCPQVFDFPIIGLPSLQLSAETYSVSCFGGADGQIFVHSANQNLVYQWSDGATGDFRADLPAGDYQVFATDGIFGCVDSLTVSIVQPIENQFIIQKNDQSCYGVADGSLQVVSLDPIFADSLYLFDWVDAPLINSPNRNGLSVGTYSVKISRGECAITLTAEITSPPSLVESFKISPPQCAGQSIGWIELTGSNENIVYKWDDDQSFLNQRTGLKPGVYSVTITDTLTGCAQLESYTVGSTTPPKFAIVSDEGVCDKQLNGAAHLNYPSDVNPDDFTILWSDNQSALSRNDLGAGSHSVRISPKDGSCDTLIQFAIVGYPPILPYYESQSPLCPNDQNGMVKLFSLVPAPYEVEYVWPNGFKYSERDNLKAGTYQIHAQLKGHKECFETFEVIVTDPLPFEIVAQIGQPLCFEDENGSIALKNSENFTFVWENGATNPIRNGLKPNVYTLTAFNEKGCEQTFNYEVKSVHGLIDAEFSFKPFSPILIYPGDQVVFENQSSEESKVFLWHFGDSETANDENPSHIYKREGEFEIKLIVWDEQKQCSDSLTKRLVLEFSPSLNIPNAFSPNGDHNNDLFEVFSSKMRLDRLAIYDRWGIEVFISEPYRPWDGTMNGKPVPEDIYIYKLDYRNEAGEKLQMIGSITLLR